MQLTHKDLEEITYVIIEKLKREFERKHLSGNLVNTIEIQNTPEKIQIHIPAQTYNMLMYQTKGVVIHTSHGSYASELDEKGSEFYIYPNGTRKGSKKIKPHNHKDFIKRVVDEAVSEWMVKQGKYDSKKVTELGD